jgi:DNA-binding HxlR family transcriptional regulator
MRWDELALQDCSVARSLSVIGDRWTLLLLRDCFLGIKRFEDFLESLQVSRTILTDRLNKLVEEDVLEKIPYQTKPLRHDYKLTSKGRDLYPVILTIVQWGDKYRGDDSVAPIWREHRKCGHVLQAELVCPDCDERVNVKDVAVRRS